MSLERENVNYFLNYPHIGKTSLFSTTDEEFNVSEAPFLWVVGDMNMLEVYWLRLVFEYVISVNAFDIIFTVSANMMHISRSGLGCSKSKKKTFHIFHLQWLNLCLTLRANAEQFNHQHARH